METAGVRLVAEGAAAFNSQLERAGQATTDFGRSADSASRGIDLMSVATSALGNALAELAIRGLDAATNAITGFIQTGFDYNKSIENATAQLVAFTGSQEAAAEAIALVERRAANTPFAFDEMAQSAASLAATSRATGISLEELLSLAERLAASNPSEGLEGAAFALREAFSGDFMSLQERFNIGKADIARIKEMGVSVESLDQVLGELGITTELVSGLAQTFDGRMSTLIDTVTKVAGAFTEPIFDFFSGAIADFQIGLDENIANLEKDARWIGQVVADVFQTIQEAWGGIWVDNATMIMPIHRFAGIATTAVKGMWDKLILLGETALPFLQEFWNVQVREIEGLKKAWEPLNSVLEAAEGLFDSLGKLGAVLGEALFGINTHMTSANKQFGKANTLGETLARFFNSLADAINSIAAVIDQVASGLERAAGAGQALETPESWQDHAPGWVPGPGDVPDTAPNGVGSSGSFPGGSTVPGTPAPAPTPSPNPTNRTTINSTIIVPAGVSPATASKIVGDGILQAQRSRGMA